MLEFLKDLALLREKIQATQKIVGLEQMKQEIFDLEKQMQDPNFWNNTEKATTISKKVSELTNEVQTWEKISSDVDALLEFSSHEEVQSDEAFEEDLRTQADALQKEFSRLEFFLLLGGKHDQKNAIVAIHAGTGGTEAQDWAEMLRRMLFRYCEKKGFTVTILDESVGSEAGIKSCVFRVEGRYAYGYLQSEHGTHRLVRLSPFNADALRQTSFALIEVIPEMDLSDAVTIDEKDLRIDTFMSGGKGGQSVNTTYSAVRIVHIPTGITVQCQNERSQLQNKETALRVLHSKLQKLQEEKEEKERLELRGEYKSAEWGNQIRSYVLHPYKMVKDIRTRYETADPDDVLNGNLEPFMEAYLKWKKSN